MRRPLTDFRRSSMPFLAYLFVSTVDFGRVFYFPQTVENCARNGAIYGSNLTTAQGRILNTCCRETAIALDLSRLTYSVAWNANNSATVNGQTVNITNAATVAVTYRWVPKAYLGGVTLSSTFAAAMSY